MPYLIYAICFFLALGIHAFAVKRVDTYAVKYAIFQGKHIRSGVSNVFVELNRAPTVNDIKVAIPGRFIDAGYELRIVGFHLYETNWRLAL